MWKAIQARHSDVKLKFDDGHLKKSRSYYRLPNQLKEGKVGTEHVVVNGKLSHFFLNNVDDCVDISDKLECIQAIVEEKDEKPETDDIISTTTMEQLREYADIIKMEYLDGYESWLHIVWSLRSISDDNIVMAKDVSKKSKKYTESGFQTAWNSFDANRKKITEKTFFNYCKLSNQRKFYELNKKYKALHQATIMEEANKIVDSFFECDCSGVEVIKEDSTYLWYNDASDNYKPMEALRKKNVILSADMGKGKTSLIKHMISTMEPSKNILFVSSRRSFASWVTNQFSYYRINNYMELKSIDESNSRRIVMSCESLTKLDADMVYDLVIIDECESFLKQFNSSTMKTLSQSFDLFFHFLKHSTSNIFADAFVTNRTLDLVRDIGGSSVLIKNTRPASTRKAIEINPCEFKEQIVEDINNDKKLFLANASRSELLKVVNSIDASKVLMYEKDSAKDVCDTLKDVNRHWSNSQIRLVGTTPKITVGVSYDKKDIFDTTYVYCKNTCCARDLTQMMTRVRHNRENNIRFALCRGNIVKVNKDDVYTYAKFQKENEQIYTLIEREMDEYLKNDVEEKHMDQAITLVDHLKDKLQNADKTLVKLMYYNQLEENISSRYFNLMFLKILNICNYECRLTKT